MNDDLLSGLPGDFDFVDLTHPFVGMPVWPTHPPFEQRRASSLEAGDVSNNHALCLSEHTGTHFGAPLHFIRGGRSIADVPVRRFFGRVATIGASDLAPDGELGVACLLDFEARHGMIAGRRRRYGNRGGNGLGLGDQFCGTGVRHDATT
jgi:kynurenine formamidase